MGPLTELLHSIAAQVADAPKSDLAADWAVWMASGLGAACVGLFAYIRSLVNKIDTIHADHRRANETKSDAIASQFAAKDADLLTVVKEQTVALLEMAAEIRTMNERDHDRDRR